MMGSAAGVAIGVAGALAIFGVFVGLVWAPIAHWRARDEGEFPLGGLNRSQWKIAWLLGLVTGSIMIVGAVYWWLWLARQNEKKEIRAGSDV